MLRPRIHSLAIMVTLALIIGLLQPIISLGQARSSERASRTWIGAEATAPPTWDITATAVLVIAGIAAHARAEYQAWLDQGVVIDFPVAILEETLFAPGGYEETTTTFTFTADDGQQGVGVQVAAVNEGEAFLTTIAITSRDDTLLGEATLGYLTTSASQLTSSVFRAEAGPGAPAQNEEIWTGGIFDRFPPAPIFPIVESVDLINTRDTYEPGSSPDPTLEDIDGGVVVVETAAPTVVAPTPTPRSTLGQGWIAYADPSSMELTLVRPNGSQKVRISGAFATQLAWSHDGTMLAYGGVPPQYSYGGHEQGIFVLRNGTITKIPGTEACSMPAFTADNQRVLYVCAGPAHQAAPSAAIIPDEVEGTSALGRYIPTMTYLGTIRSATVDGTDERIDYELTPDDLPTVWMNPAYEVMVVRLHVSPASGEVLVVYSDAAYPPTTIGGAVFSAEFTHQQTISALTIGVIPTMLPDGTILQLHHCDGGPCPATGYHTEFTDLAGNPVIIPVLQNDDVIPAWATTLSPTGDASLNWNYYDGVWILYPDGTTFTLNATSSVAQPQWQPIPVEIALP